MKYAIIIITSSIIISLVLAIFLVWPEYRAFNDVNKQLAQKILQLENQNKYIQSLKIADGQLKEKAELVEKINSALPNKVDIPSLLEFLQEASVSSGVNLNKISWENVSSEENKEIIKKHYFSAEITGSYFALKNFLFAVETSARLINIEQLNLATSSGKNQPMTIVIRARVNSY
ncbi:MAG: type 4a pilus biogenesis protein PilO [Candidatus Parcubacteria bacterium]|nr:type 4a pilus biogenesis protein PilO [Candidatus Parcubacteria bacterium]